MQAGSRRLVIQVVVGAVIAVFMVETWISSHQVELGWLKYFSTAVFAAGLVFSLWESSIWRIPLVQRIPGVPLCIRGIWKGELASFWIDPQTGTRIAPKVAFLVVRQTAGSVSVTLLTDESRSSSSLADIRQVDGLTMLSYMYLNRPDMAVEHRSRMHHGSCVLDVFGSPPARLDGRYWTDRDTRGELNFSEHTKKLADNFEDASRLFG